MNVGEIFTADKMRWLVYEISEDGIVRSRAVGKAETKSSKPTLTTPTDRNRQCTFQTNRKRGRVDRCQKHPIIGSTLCAEHQWAKRYAVNRTAD